MIELNRQIMLDTIKFYGIDNQLTVAIEEMAELMQVLSKIKRKEFPFDREHLVEEMADVYYTQCQLKEYYQITDEDLSDAIWKKQMRQTQRMLSEGA